MRDTDQNKRREELQKRIEDTRRKLQNIGYQSMLRGSQSISDLTSHLPDKYKQQSASRPDSAMSDYHTHVTNRSCKYTTFNTSYLTDSYIMFTLKMDSVAKNTIFGLKMRVKSGLEKFILKSLRVGR